MKKTTTADPSISRALTSLYAKLSHTEGVVVSELAALVDEFSRWPMDTADLQAFREGRPPWKKLRDEVLPVEHLLGSICAPDTRVRFPLDDKSPDALILGGEAQPQGLEVTGALARAGIEVAKGLRERGVGRGFIGLPDRASQKAFDAARTSRRITSSRTGVDAAIDAAIGDAMARKDKAKFAGQILLIVAPLGSSPDRSAGEIRAVHAKSAGLMPFAKVFVADTERRGRIVELK